MHDQQGAGDPPDAPAKRHWRWPVTRLTHAAFLYGQGRTLEQIAADLFIQSNERGVRRALKRAGVYVGADLPPGQHSYDLDRRRADILESAAAKRGVTLPVFVRKVLEILADDPALLDNVLDDGG